MSNGNYKTVSTALPQPHPVDNALSSNTNNHLGVAKPTSVEPQEEEEDDYDDEYNYDEDYYDEDYDEDDYYYDEDDDTDNSQDTSNQQLNSRPWGNQQELQTTESHNVEANNIRHLWNGKFSNERNGNGYWLLNWYIAKIIYQFY